MAKVKLSKEASVNKVVEFLELGHSVDTILSYFVNNCQVVDRTVHRYIAEARIIHQTKQQTINKELDAIALDAKKKEREMALYDVMDIKEKLKAIIDNDQLDTKDTLKAIDQYTKMVGGYAPIKTEVKDTTEFTPEERTRRLRKLQEKLAGKTDAD